MSKMYDNITGRSPIATDDLGYIGTGNKASDILNSGTTDYDNLNNKPTINSVELKGDLTSNDLGLQPELTEAQTNAVNSGITAALTEQITTNKNNISLIEQMNGAKNYLYYAAPTETYTTGGANLTVTNNGDGTMTMNGTTGTANVYCGVTKHAVKPMILTAGQYVLTGIDETAPVGVVLYITAYGGSTQLATISSQYPIATLTIATDGEYSCNALVNNDKTLDNLVLKPMVCKKSVYDSGLTQFMPYAMSNAEISAWILAHS